MNILLILGAFAGLATTALGFWWAYDYSMSGELAYDPTLERNCKYMCIGGLAVFIGCVLGMLS